MRYTNKNFKKDLDRMAQLRGQRPQLPTRIRSNNKKQILNRERERDIEQDLQDFYNVR